MKAKNGSGTGVSLSPASGTLSRLSWVEKVPGVCGGDARIRKTRITVWGLVQRRDHGLSDSEILERLPGLTDSDLSAAWVYYESHREEIDQAIRDNAAP